MIFFFWFEVQGLQLICVTILIVHLLPINGRLNMTTNPIEPASRSKPAAAIKINSVYIDCTFLCTLYPKSHTHTIHLRWGEKMPKRLLSHITTYFGFDVAVSIFTLKHITGKQCNKTKIWNGNCAAVAELRLFNAMSDSGLAARNETIVALNPSSIFYSLAMVVCAMCAWCYNMGMRASDTFKETNRQNYSVPTTLHFALSRWLQAKQHDACWILMLYIYCTNTIRTSTEKRNLLLHSTARASRRDRSFW